MNKYTVRIELFDTKADDDEYYKLHAAMRKAGFKTTITDDETHVEYHLPPAEYNYIGEETDKEVICNLAAKAAQTTGHEFSILVTAGGRSWDNLKPVRKLKTN